MVFALVDRQEVEVNVVNASGDRMVTKSLGILERPTREEVSLVASLLPKQYGRCASMVAKFFAFLSERQEMWRRKISGLPPPFTKDPTLESHSFCNVREETVEETETRRGRRDDWSRAHLVVCYSVSLTEQT